MPFTHFSPGWFSGYDVVFELIFMIISLVLSIFAFRIYKASGQKQVKLFGTAFIFISISYLIQSIFNFMIISKATENISRAMKIQSIALFNTLGIFAHMILMMVGLVILTYMTFKIRKQRILWLLLLVSLLAMLLSKNSHYLFYLLSSLYLGFISWHFIKNYLEKKQKKTLLIAIAFLFLLAGRIHFIFSINHQLFYVMGHILELIAYLIILWNFYLVGKK